MIKNVNLLKWWFFPKSYIFNYPNVTQSDDRSCEYNVPGWEKIELISDKKRLNEVNKATGVEYLGGAGNEFLTPLFGRQSVFTLDFESHQLARKLISQALSRRRVDDMTVAINRIVTDEFLSLSDGEVVQAGLFSRKLSMKIASLFIISPVVTTSQTKNLFKNLEKATGFRANIVSYNKWLWSSFLTKSIVTRVDAAIEKVIQENSLPDSYSVLHVLLKNKDEYGYDMTFIRDNIISSLSAGYDTTGSALTWMLFWLAKDNHYSRLKKFYGTKDYDAVIESFVLETLRYCPPLEILPRRQSLAEGDSTLVCPCPHLVHHDQERYHNPEVFDPLRFFSRRPVNQDFLAFGAASRVCLGAYLAKDILDKSLRYMIENGIYLDFKQKKFKPIRRNVSLWPSFLNLAHVSIVDKERNSSLNI